MTTSQKIKRLSALLDEAAKHQVKSFTDTEFFSWRSYTENSIMEIFGPNSFQIVEFRRLRFKFNRTMIIVGGRDTSQADKEATKQIYARDLRTFIGTFQWYLNDLQEEVQEEAQQILSTAPLSLAHLHPTANSLFATNHYPQAIQAACTALEKAIQQKSGQSVSTTGTALIGKAFPKDNPLIHLSDDQGEREGYGFLYRGLLQAIRNHYSHNLTQVPAARALEWLGFISALFANRQP